MSQENSQVTYEQDRKRGEVKEGDTLAIILNGSVTVFTATVGTGKRGNFEFNFEEYDWTAPE